MDGAQYDAKILNAALTLKGAPPEAARKLTQALARVSRSKVSGEGPAPRWFEVQARVAAARKVLADAVDGWQRAVTEPAKQLARDAVRKVKDAVQGALDAAGAAGSAARQTWRDVLDEVDRTIGTIGGGFVGGLLSVPLILLVVTVFVLYQSNKRSA